ncbi:MAG: class I SAM-dependent methyltransferase [Rhizobium sp.]|nr:class I SAM-dependent methyltransferase [Rhizobium sp.]
MRKLYQEFGLEDRPCVLCGGKTFTLICEGDRYGFDLDKQICDQCGLVQTSPAVKKDFLNVFYRDHYRRLYTKRNDVDHSGLVREQREKGKRFLEYLQKTEVASKLQDLAVIELGCSSGGIIETFKPHCRSVQGCDLDVEAIRYGREQLKLDLEVSEFPTQLPAGPRLFILSHVLEHTHDPLASLKQIKSLMTADDYLFIEVPGLNLVGEGAYSYDLKSYFHLAHVTDFSEGTLRALAARAGYDVLSCNETVTALLRPSAQEELPWQRSDKDTPENILRIEKARTKR